MTHAPATGGPRFRLLQAVDAAAYAATVAAGAFLASGALGFALGTGWVGAKYYLFVLGFILFGYGIYLLAPSAPYKQRSHGRLGGGRSLFGRMPSIGSRADEPLDGTDASTGGTSSSDRSAREIRNATAAGDDPPSAPESRSQVESVVVRVLPRGLVLPVTDRLSVGAKLFLGGLFVLATSFLMEAAFGVAAATGA